jgi:hypothetical protein
LDLLLVVVTPLIAILITMRAIEVHSQKKDNYITIELSVSSGTIYAGQLSFLAENTCGLGRRLFFV